MHVRGAVLCLTLMLDVEGSIDTLLMGDTLEVEGAR